MTRPMIETGWGNISRRGSRGLGYRGTVIIPGNLIETGFFFAAEWTFDRSEAKMRQRGYICKHSCADVRSPGSHRSVKLEIFAFSRCGTLVERK